jgi:hypothetical protein
MTGGGILNRADEFIDVDALAGQVAVIGGMPQPSRRCLELFGRIRFSP